MDGFQLAEKLVAWVMTSPSSLTARNENGRSSPGSEIAPRLYHQPFDVDELVLCGSGISIRRIPAATPVSPPPSSGATYSSIKDTLKLHIGRQKEIVLTPRESELLDYLFRKRTASSVAKRSSPSLGENDYFLGRSLDVFISRPPQTPQASRFISIDKVYGVGFVSTSMIPPAATPENPEHRFGKNIKYRRLLPYCLIV